MATGGFALFETPIGPCGVAWDERRLLRGVQLPEGGERATRVRMKARFPELAESPPPREVRRGIAAMQALLGGRKSDLSELALDLDSLPPFRRRVYEAARRIPAGSTVSYGELATALGAPNSARAVGQALGRNPFPIVVPCHRVLAAGGKPGGFTAAGGVDTKKRMLALEAARAATGARAGQNAPATATRSRTKAGAMPPRRAAAAAQAPAGAAEARDAGAQLDVRAAVQGLRRADPVLAKLIDRIGPCRLEVNRAPSVFAALARAIVYQQLSGKAAATIHGRVGALFPRAKDGFTPRHILGATDEQLRSAGLSRAKTAALRDLAQKTTDRAIPTLDEVHVLTDDEIVARLTTVRGIGRWTVEMLLMFRLGRPDVLPVDDYGVRKGFAAAWSLDRLPSPKELEHHGQRWAPWRTTASWYLWRAADAAAATSAKR